ALGSAGGQPNDGDNVVARRSAVAGSFRIAGQGEGAVGRDNTAGTDGVDGIVANGVEDDSRALARLALVGHLAGARLEFRPRPATDQGCEHDQTQKCRTANEHHGEQMAHGSVSWRPKNNAEFSAPRFTTSGEKTTLEKRKNTGTLYPRRGNR